MAKYNFLRTPYEEEYKFYSEEKKFFLKLDKLLEKELSELEYVNSHYSQPRKFFKSIELLNTNKYSTQQLKLNKGLIIALREGYLFNSDKNLVNAEKLIKLGADVNLKFNTTKRVRDIKREYIQEKLGANVNLWCSKTKEHTLLSMVIQENELKSVQFLFENGFKLNTLTSYKICKLLGEAIGNNNIDIVRILLENGADPNITDKDGNSAVTEAATRNLEMLEMVLEYKGNVNPVNINCNVKTPLIMALIYLSEDQLLPMVQKLIQHRANLEDPDYANLTPLQNAINRKRKFDVIKELLKMGAKVDYDIFKDLNKDFKKSYIEEVKKLLNDAQLADKFLENPLGVLLLSELNDIELFALRIVYIITKQGIDDTFEEYRLDFNENDSIPDEIKEIFNSKLIEINAVKHVKSSRSHGRNDSEKSVADANDQEKESEKLPIQDESQNDENYKLSKGAEIFGNNSSFTEINQELVGVNAVLSENDQELAGVNTDVNKIHVDDIES